MNTLSNQPLTPGSVIAYSDLPAAKWRNGGGTTRQILSGKLSMAGAPETVTGDDWDWRLSIADVDTAGDFSAFTGMTRILTVIEGELLAMKIDGQEKQLERFRPLRFDGGSATSATLPTGPIRDLNLIARTGTVTGHVAIVELSKKHPQHLFGGQFGVLLQGKATLNTADGTQAELGRLDTVVGGEQETPTISGRGFLAVVSLDPA
ncbi:HutD/Ves family protein [Paeniglutamicibacter cryotolerans]|uniref:HutD family protein n=1 Tax=Paeniglutamicibacter cryotolerans TaxID=670079 RepID=A0A839QJQ3_9MICC|nr:HutD family protein [Paeniglutamicibacter cryotolerans]MBB2996070.1 hypothetical protein [Paeniglutamicibacter cryotolerans]